MTITKEEIRRLKELSCKRDKRGSDTFYASVIIPNGRLTAETLRAIAEAADRYGNGNAVLTTHMTVEIQGIPYRNMEPLLSFLAENGLETGGNGYRVRPVISCKGTTCPRGLLDTYALSEKIHARFYDGCRQWLLPNKFNIAIGGCPNNCLSPKTNDLGIIGQRTIRWDTQACRGCTECSIEKACPVHAARIVDGKITADSCRSCGQCVGKCPFHVTDHYTDGCRIYIGGHLGREIAVGRPLNAFFIQESDIMEIIQRAILLFRDEGIHGERFSDTIQRLGFEYVEAKLLQK